MKFGIWLPVYGSWLRTHDEPTAPDVASCLAIAQQAEALGFDLLYASENQLNCIHGPSEGVADAWSLLTAIAATTSKVELCGAVKPGFRSPFLVARMLDTVSKIAERRLSVNIVCGWWEQEFLLSGVEWLDHDGRYDRAARFLRSVYNLFRPAIDISPTAADLDEAPVVPREKSTISSSQPASYGLDQAALPGIWISGHSPRATQIAAEWGDCLYINGMSDQDLRRHIALARQEANRWGRNLSIAVNAYVIATEAAGEAQHRWKSVLSRRNFATIEFFRTVMEASGAIAWANLTEAQMVDSNAGFELGLIGSFDEVRERIPVLEGIGVDQIVCQFDDPMRDAGPFMKRVIRPLRERALASLDT